MGHSATTGLERVDRVLRPTTVTRIPRTHIIIDTESERKYARGTESQTWALACWTVLDYTGRKSLLPGTVRCEHSPKDLWVHITRLCRKGHRTVLWAHNLGYDLRISSGFIVLPALGWHLEAAVLERQAAWARWTRNGATLLMCDLYSWIPTSLEHIAKDMGMTKYRLADGDLETRCTRDVVITAKAVAQVLDHLWGQDLGSFRPTGAGMAYSAFARQHMTHKIVSHADTDQLHLERTAMWTGRCEVWKWGKDHGRPAYEYDIERAYAHIGVSCDVPTRYLARTECKDYETFQSLSNSYRLLCDCTVRTRVPTVPCRRDVFIVWPVGEFRTTLWDTEVRLCVDNGGDIDIHSISLYRKAPALSSYCDWILTQLGQYTSDHPSPWSRVLKSWSRSMIGRLALQYAGWEYVGDAPTTWAGISRTIRPDTGEQGFDLHIGTDYFELGDIQEGFCSVPMITGWVMAEARVRLWRIMQMAGLDNVRYVDTDGLIVTSAGKRRLDSAIALGRAYTLRPKQAYRTVNIRAPRNLDAGLTRKIAGVPLKAHYSSDGVYDGDVWRGVSDSLARSEPDTVKVTPRTFTTKQTDTRRIHLPHYQTLPHTIGENDGL